MAVSLNSYTGDVACNMEDYTCAAYLHMADLGIAGWDAMRDWKIQDQIARTNGTSGYNRSLVDTYTRILTEGAWWCRCLRIGQRCWRGTSPITSTTTGVVMTRAGAYERQRRT